MTINCQGKLLDLSSPRIMGILNITEDSFFDGGQYNSIDSAINQVSKMVMEGADIIDIGGQSSRPGAIMKSADEEWKLLEPILTEIKQTFPDIILSIDTYWSKVAEKSVQLGVSIINDISAGSIDNQMFNAVAELKVPYVLMHMQGTPETMQLQPKYKDIVTDINYFFSEKINELRQLGVDDIILDPGFGFGKTIDQNYELLKNLNVIGFEDYLLLAGISRKSMIYKYLDQTPEESLIGTAALNLIALQKGANILRVHDVKEAKDMIKLNTILK